MKLKYFYLTLLTILAITSCEKFNDNETLISKLDSDESHKSGENCMICHRDGGKGEGWFTFAGTVYNKEQTSTNPNSTVKIVSRKNGQEEHLLTIEVDKNGNFYTTEKVDTSSLFTYVIGTDTSLMYTPITHGQCNACHGVSTDKIWAE